MNDADGSGMKEKNIRRLREIAGLVPNHGITVEVFEYIYPDATDAAKGQNDADITISQLLTWYLSSINLESQAHKRELEAIKVQLRERDEAHKREVEAIKVQLRERDEAHKREVEALKGQMEQRDQRLKEKDQRLAKAENESSDIVTALVDVAKRDRMVHQKRGTVTRSEAWNSLEISGHAKDTSCISKQNSSDAERLTAKFAAIERSEWTEEADMYPDIIKPIESTLYSSPPPAINVVDTSKLREFPADVSIADYLDERVPYGVRYFIELKWPKGNLISAENCGQMLDYFDIAHERQPHRLAFAAILSNFDAAFVFEADYRGDSVTIYRKAAPTLVDAIIYVDQLSREQYQPIPPIHNLFSSNYSFIDNSRHHVLLSVPCPTSGSTGMQTKSKRLAREQSWRDPSRFLRGDKRFVLKMARGGLDVSNEVRILKAIKDARCERLPELVWSPAGHKELGIVPVGQPIDFQQPANMARRVVEGMVDGLQYLHSQGIIHRDIRPSNLIVHYMDVVIVDFETSVFADSSKEVIYEGGHICWPKRLLESNMKRYIPEPADDLFACILVVLHLLFPSRFNMFHQGSISIGMPRTRETTKLLQLWNDIEKSKIWEPFVKAARMEEYDNLKVMADVFCSV